MAPLHYAAEHALADVVAVFLKAGVEVDSTYRGRTALHYAAGRTTQYCARGVVKDRISSALAKRHEATTRVLLESGAEVNATELLGGLTPLYLAASSGMYEVCRVLLAAGVSVDQTSPFGIRPLVYAYTWCPWLPHHQLVNGSDARLRCRRVMRIVPLLLRAGAALPEMPVLTPADLHFHSDDSDASDDDPPNRLFDCPYIRKVRSAGGFQAYEKQHLAALVALLAPKLAHLVPTDVVPRIVSFWYPVGFW